MEFICNDCPRKCNILRNTLQNFGYCGCLSLPTVIRAAPHFGEEPCITGKNGSGAIFFTGCNLKCIFCQNEEISTKGIGKVVSINELVNIMHYLQDKGVSNINLVTPTHFTSSIIKALEIAKLNIPVVWNSSGYEDVKSLKRLEGLVQVYLPDIKYMDSLLSAKLSNANDYPIKVKLAVLEMFRQTGPYSINDNGIIEKGVIIRHLILPGYLNNSKHVIDWVSENFNKSDILFSLMSQYTPNKNVSDIPKLKRSITEKEYKIVKNYLLDSGFSEGYLQDLNSATNEYLPSFDYTGIN